MFAESGIRSNPLIGDSVSDYGLQTNDFFVGSIGYLFNTPDSQASPPVGHYISIFSDIALEIPFRDFQGDIAVK